MWGPIWVTSPTDQTIWESLPQPGQWLILLGYLKDPVYENSPQTIGELKAAFMARIRAIPRKECVRVIDNFAPRIRSALHAKVDIWSTFWRGNKIKTTKTWKLKFLGLNCYHIKLMWTKNEGCLLSDVEMAVSEMGCNHFRRSALDAKVDIWSAF